MSEKFNPKDEQYKEVADLPPKEQERYMDVADGGFVSREAIFNQETAWEMAHTEKNQRIFERLGATTLQELVEGLAKERYIEYIPLSGGVTLVSVISGRENGLELNGKKIGYLVWRDRIAANVGYVDFVYGSQVRSFSSVCLCGYGGKNDGCGYLGGLKVSSIVEEYQEAMRQHGIEAIVTRVKGSDAPSAIEIGEPHVSLRFSDDPFRDEE